MRVLTLLLAVAVAMASAELAPANRQLLSLQEVVAKLAPQLRTDLLKLESAIPAELKTKLEALLAMDKPDLQALLGKLTALQAAAPDAATLAAVLPVIAKVVDAAIGNQTLDPAALAAVLKLLPDGSTLPATLTVPGVADMAGLLHAKFQLNPGVLTQLTQLISTGSAPQISDILSKLVQATGNNGLSAEQLTRILAALNAGKAVDSPLQTILQIALNGAPLPLAMKVDNLLSLVDAVPAEDKAKLSTILSKNGLPDLDKLIVLLRDAVANGIPKALLHQVLAAVSSDAKIDAGVASQVQANLAPGDELPRAFVQSAGTSATSTSSSSDPGAGVIAAASIASVVVVGAAVAALHQRRKVAEVQAGKQQAIQAQSC